MKSAKSLSTPSVQDESDDTVINKGSEQTASYRAVKSVTSTLMLYKESRNNHNKPVNRPQATVSHDNSSMCSTSPELRYPCPPDHFHTFLTGETQGTIEVPLAYIRSAKLAHAGKPGTSLSLTLSVT